MAKERRYAQSRYSGLNITIYIFSRLYIYKCIIEVSSSRHVCTRCNAQSVNYKQFRLVD